MLDPIPSCFRGGAITAPPASTAAGPNLSTSIYETHLGLAALTWSRTVLGLSLRVDLRLSFCSSSTTSSSDTSSVSSSTAVECTDATFRFYVRPWLFWKRRGSKRFHLKDHHHHRTVDFAWDLSRASFPASGGPEPSAGFFVAVAVDGEMFLVVGDSEEDAYKKTISKRHGARNPSSRKGSLAARAMLISRREHVVLPGSGGTPYTTRARFGGKEREISIDLGGGGGERGDGRMCLGLDGKRILHVKRLKWKFRGSERVEVEGGARMQVSWDVHNWLFDKEIADSTTSSSSSAVAASELGHAVFVFRFEREGAEKGDSGYFGKKKNNDAATDSTRNGGGGLYRDGYFGNSDKSNSSIIGGVGGRRAAKKRSLLKTSSSSSSSSASSGSSSSVMEWSSAEENELQGSDGFSLLVYLWKS